MTDAEERIFAQAAAWHSASEQDYMDWDGFTNWLEADPRHQSAYDDIALTDSRLQALVSQIRLPPLPANDQDIDTEQDGTVSAQRKVAGWRWAAAAIAASLAVLLAIPQFLGANTQTFETSTVSQTIALADGSQVILAPHSTLEVDGGEVQLALNGAAWFDIKHNPSRHMVITAGGLQIGDIGTKFDVQDAAGQVRIAVTEGSVSVSSPTLVKPVVLTAGRGLLFNPAGGKALVQPVKVDEAGSWRSGRISYEAAPLPLVAADLSRYANMQVAIAGPLQNRTFSGTLNIEDGEAALRDLSQLMGVNAVDDGGSYRLVPADR